MAKKETVDATIINSPMFPCFWEAVLLIAAFWGADLLEAGLLGGLHFCEATLLGSCAFGANGCANMARVHQMIALDVGSTMLVFWEANMVVGTSYGLWM